MSDAIEQERKRFEVWADGSFELRWHVELGRYASCMTQSAWAHGKQLARRGGSAYLSSRQKP